MAQFGKSRSRKDVFDDYLANGGDSLSKPGEIGRVYTLSDFDSKKAGNFNSPAPPSPENLRYSKNVSFINKYFSDRQTHHFKNGLELANNTGDKENVSNIENLDEDPVIFGFDFIINHISSPLFDRTEKQNGNNLGDGTIDEFFRFAISNGLKEIENRVGIYNQFLNQLELLFLSTRGGSFDTFKGHYIIGVDGLSDLVNKSTGLGSNKQFTDFGKDKITLTLREDTHLSGGYLTTLYNTLSYSKINGKQVIPDNLLRFDATIVVSEIRNYKRIRKQISNGDSRELTTLVNDSVSRYMYNLYDCQFVFEKHSHPSNVKNDSKEVTDSFEMGFFYKFSSLEMEKFKFNPDEINVNYINDGNPVDPKRKYVGESSNDINAVRRNEFINLGYQEGIDPYAIYAYAIYDIPTNNNIEDFSTINSNVDDISAIRRNSIQSSYEEQKIQQEQQRIDALNKKKTNSLKKNVENSIKGYENIIDPPETFGEGGGIQGIINRTKEQALKRARFRRDTLINNTLQSIRTATGLRRIASPINVYDNNSSIFGQLKNELRNFTNTGFSGLIDGIDDSL